jgi:hypothetical protein
MSSAGIAIAARSASGTGTTAWPRERWREAVKQEDWRSNAATRERLAQAREIIAEYKAAMTVRQLFYQFVSRGLIENSQRSYKTIGDLMNRGRMAGFIKWSAINDLTRSIHFTYRDDGFEENRTASVLVSRGGYSDLWGASQNWEPLVLIEKDALLGTIQPACRGVSYGSLRGYSSITIKRQIAEWVGEQCKKGNKPLIWYLGDHDPSGIQMGEELQEWLEEALGHGVEFERLALNEEQIAQYNPPPNLVKDSDKRSAAYKDDYGEGCWELDALPPSVLQALITDKIEEHYDHDRASKVSEVMDACREEAAALEEKLKAKLESDEILPVKVAPLEPLSHDYQPSAVTAKAKTSEALADVMREVRAQANNGFRRRTFA